MKKLISLILIIPSFLMLACSDDDDSKAEQLKRDIDLIENYLSQNGFVAQSTESGLHYIIEEQGTGEFPDINSLVTVDYTGSLLDGTVFDSGINAFFLSSVIEGWQEGLSLIKEGGSITLFIPSGLGYGDTEIDGIPANSVLIFHIHLKMVTK